MDLHPLNLRVTHYAAQAKDVVLIELRAVDGRSLPPFSAGSHLEILVPGNLPRHYSLLNAPDEHDRYVIAVGLAPESRGGSRYLHQQLRLGDTLACSLPRNHFPLNERLDRYCLVAGGIGITPILAMLRWFQANGKDWRLVYSARNRQRAAFYETLCELDPVRVRMHFDDEAGGHLDTAQLLDTLRDGEHLYACGPAPMLDALQGAAGARAERVHIERFSAAPVSTASDTGFTVHLQRSDRSLWVGPEQSILEALEAHGIQLPFSCRSGICGSCETTVCAGNPEHRDLILSDAEKADGRSLMICVSRALSDSLVLDL
ncbi:PDR/VanB family oxidoreductase [Pseudomonas asiatica]|uniref:PDR/VanB family oxidoreductase n=1 Tax=Pseudomonas asiatica TaxID=2219225 RepID=UPI0025710385|nr:PDR/VanB family oxidoreductase [Pseudomonas asiatica]WJD72328.1 PDR/VanB family oxidoreductase [Pseudomonas asiatica]